VEREELDLSCNTGLASATACRSASWSVMSTQSVRSTPPLCVLCVAGEIKFLRGALLLRTEPAAGGGRLDDQTKINQRISPHQHQLDPEQTQAYFIFLFPFSSVFPSPSLTLPQSIKSTKRPGAAAVRSTARSTCLQKKRKIKKNATPTCYRAPLPLGLVPRKWL